MPDVVSPEKRSQMMAGIRGKDTRPELAIRQALHRLGYRYRLHVKELPGKPDLVFPKYRAVILVNGCFWHGHDCHLFRWPGTRREFWRTKIERNCFVDARASRELGAIGWRALAVWECAIKGRDRMDAIALVATIAEWLESGSQSASIPHDRRITGQDKNASV